MAETITFPSPSAILRPQSPPPYPTEPTTLKNARRASPAEAKKKKARKAAGTSNGADSSVVKQKQTKSRNGCRTCKEKRLKCDELKPTCLQCTNRNVECGGYKKDFKWRPFEDANPRLNVGKQKTGYSPKQLSPVSSKSTTPLSDKPSTNVQVEARRRDAAKKKKDSVTDAEVASSQVLSPRHPDACAKQQTLREFTQSSSPENGQEVPPPPLLIPDATPQTCSEGATISADLLQHGSLFHLTPGLGLSPSLTNSLLPWNTDNPALQNFIEFELPESYHAPLPTDAAIEEMMMSDEGLMHNLSLSSIAHHHPHMDSTSPGSSSHDVTGANSDMFGPQPFYADDSREMLSHRFDRLTCGILSIVDGPEENPWRSLMWPLALQSPAVYHAITAMTAYHSAIDIPSYYLVGHQHKVTSIQYIQEGINNNSFLMQTAIAASLALGFAECWDQSTSTGSQLNRGTQILVQRALDDNRRNPWTGKDRTILKFLCNAWVYRDVIARLTAVDSDETTDHDDFLFPNDPGNGPAMIMNDSGFGIDFGMPVDQRLDPLMGCAGTLFPLIGRVANLVRKVVLGETNSPAIISQAIDLKRALEAWEPPSTITPPADPSVDVSHTEHTAEAYRWATLLHLHQSVPELPSLTTVGLAAKVLRNLAIVPPTSRTVIVHTYPLMVAGCEAKEALDRQWVRTRWAAMNALMRVGIIDKCVKVTEEVWARRDAYENLHKANRKLVRTPEPPPTGSRDPSLVGAPTSRFGLDDPGRVGMIWTFMETENDGNESDGDIHKKRSRDRFNGRDPRLERIDPAYTVRGPLHWVGVMWDWEWEVLLG